MLSVLTITFPFFALVLCSYLAARGGCRPGHPGLNAFVLYFALPCVLYRFGASTPIGKLLDPAVAGMCCARWSWWGHGGAHAQCPHRLERCCLSAPGRGLSNTGFMGVPLLVALLGRKARARPSSSWSTWSSPARCALRCRGWMVPVRRAWRGRCATRLKGMATNPMPWSIALGALASALQVQLPGPVDKTIAMLADAASPVALFTIGAVLARSQMNQQHEQVLARDYVPWRWPNCWCTRCWCGAWARRPPWACRCRRLRSRCWCCWLRCSASNVAAGRKFGAHNGRIARIILACRTSASTVRAEPAQNQGAPCRAALGTKARANRYNLKKCRRAAKHSNWCRAKNRPQRANAAQLKSRGGIFC